MSSYSGEAAEQVVRMSLEGAEVAVRLAGTGAKHLAILLYSVLKDQKKTRGKIRLTNMLRSGKELKVFAVMDSDLQKFCEEAKKYGVLYTVLKDRDSTDGLTDVMVRAEDASKINRIFERFHLTTVDMGADRTGAGGKSAGSTEGRSSAEAYDGTGKEGRVCGQVAGGTGSTGPKQRGRKRDEVPSVRTFLREEIAWRKRPGL